MRNFLRALVLDVSISLDYRQEALGHLIKLEIEESRKVDRRVSLGGIMVDPEVFEECKRLAGVGEKIKAIKALKHACGGGLRETKEAVEKEFYGANPYEAPHLGANPYKAPLIEGPSDSDIPF